MLVTAKKLFKFYKCDINKKLKTNGGGDNMKKISNFKMYKKCLIVVDMVNGFVREGVLHDNSIANIIPIHIKLIKEALASEDTIVIFIKDTHTKNSKEFKRFGNTKHCVKGTKEAELVDELIPYEGLDNTISIEKNSTSFMEAPDFRKIVKELNNVEEYGICGCCTDICVVNGTIGLANYNDQWNRDVTIKAYQDAIATYGENIRQNYIDAAYLLMEQQGIQLVKSK